MSRLTKAAMSNLLANRKVFVVEDEMLVLMMIESMLEDLGCTEVVVASTVQSALTLVGNNDFDIAMLDMNLGGANSSVIADALDTKRVPFVFCTGNASGDSRLGARPRRVLRKPFDFEALAAALTDLLLECENLSPAA